MIMNAYCAQCLTDSWSARCPADASPETAAEYRRRVRRVVTENAAWSSPEKDWALRGLWADMFGPMTDYAPIKRHFNALMMAMEPSLAAAAMADPDPLRRAAQYAMAGNFIDFAAMDSVDEKELRRQIERSADIPIDAGALEALRVEIAGAKRLTYILDNCGEIAMDRVLMRVIRRLNPEIEITALVKGAPIVNDATREDAEQARLHEVAERIADTGCGVAGVPEGRVSDACRRAMAEADMLISKGQANYETLCGCGLNIFYLFMCKCRLFTERFGVPLYGGVLTRE